MTCSQCGNPLQPGWMACPRCGMQFSQPVPGVPQQPYAGAPPPSYAAVQPPPSKRSPNYLLGCLIGGMLLVFFGMIGIVAITAIGSVANSKHSNTASSGSDEAEKEQGAAGDTASDDAKTAESSDDAVTDKADASPPVDKDGAASDRANVTVKDIPNVGKRDVALVDGIEYYIDLAEVRTVGIRGVAPAHPDGEFLIVRLVATNSDQKPHSFMPSAIVLQDGRGRDFGPSNDGEAALKLTGDKTADLGAAELRPSDMKSVALVYDVPKDDSGLTITLLSGSANSESNAVLEVSSSE
jgi:hypothetical protein